MRTTEAQRMKIELIPCGKGFIRFGSHDGKPGYIMMDVLGFVNTAAKGSELAKTLPKSYTFRCAVNGIPGRPNICVTLAGIDRICSEQSLLTDDLIEFADKERVKNIYNIIKEPVPVMTEEVKEFKELVPVIENLDYLIKIHKRLKRIEAKMDVIYEALK